MKGPWTYVAPDKLPADFARIPVSHAKASVLVSVAGTPQAKEAMIAKSIPQTATVTRSTTALTVEYDGMPEFKPVENTSLQYAVNTSTPVIAVSSNNYYAVYSGVWFVATSPRGPWVVATTVPGVIYSIPVSSPLHHVTYVKIYGSTPEVVYVGYTPGYHGTVVTSSNVVVYGTGWYYPPYVGAYWYGAPYTYGYGVVFNWGVASGWSYAYATNYYSARRRRVGQCLHRQCWLCPLVHRNNCKQHSLCHSRRNEHERLHWYHSNRRWRCCLQPKHRPHGAAGQAGTAYNAYTGNSAAGARGVTYNPQTGVISGGAVGGVRNGSTGEVTAGRSAFAYNPNTNTGVAVAQQQRLRRSQRQYSIATTSQPEFSSELSNGWESVQRPQDRSWVQNQHQARTSRPAAHAESWRNRPAAGSVRRNFGGGGGFRGRR